MAAAMVGGAMNASAQALEVTILMPCLNEVETIAACVCKARRFLESRNIQGEILVADNGSTDGSQAVSIRCGARVVPVPVQGYGAALLGGIQAARGKFIIMGDADDSYDFTALDPFVEKLRQGFDLVMGNRFLGGIKPHAMPPLHKYLGNPVLTGIGRLFFRSPCGDFHCGLRGFRREAVLSLALTAPGMEFASEMVVKATLRKLRITEVPTTLSPDGRSRPPHLRSWRDGWRHLRFLVLFSPAWLFFYPGALLLLLGVAGMVWLLPGQQAAGRVNFDVNTLAYAAAAVICGFQAVVFYVFAKTYAIRHGLLPEDRTVYRLHRLMRLEIGLVAGLALMLIGLTLAAYALGSWGLRSFGPLQPDQSLRIVIPSATLLILGLQVMFSSCLLSILQLETRNALARTRESDRSAAAVPEALVAESMRAPVA
jgi:glycosyltransferase involved in cell wall biosynthesis